MTKRQVPLRNILGQRRASRWNGLNFDKGDKGMVNLHCIKQYIVLLTKLAATCNFGALTDKMIRDQIIEKITIPRIRECLLMEDDSLTLDKATTLAIQI